MAQKRLPDDFRDFLNSLNKHKVKYLLLGGWAVGIHGAPRFTADLDVFVAVDDKNIDKLLHALYEFGAPTIPREAFQDIGRVFRMGRAPIKIEILNQASGIDFEQCYRHRKRVTLDGVKVSLISASDLLKNKAASGREKDIADLRNLEGILNRPGKKRAKR